MDTVLPATFWKRFTLMKPWHWRFFFPKRVGPSGGSRRYKFAMWTAHVESNFVYLWRGDKANGGVLHVVGWLLRILRAERPYSYGTAHDPTRLNT